MAVGRGERSARLSRDTEPSLAGLVVRFRLSSMITRLTGVTSLSAWLVRVNASWPHKRNAAPLPLLRWSGASVFRVRRQPSWPSPPRGDSERAVPTATARICGSRRVRFPPATRPCGMGASCCPGRHDRAKARPCSASGSSGPGPPRVARRASALGSHRGMKLRHQLGGHPAAGADFDALLPGSLADI
jgi:hypothetical protein